MHQHIVTPAARASSPSPGRLLQRQCGCSHKSAGEGECEECKKKKEGQLQRAAAGGNAAGEAPVIVQDVLQSPGQPLDPAIRNFMEPRFGHSFGDVRVHTDNRAAQSAAAVNALAYTVGQDVVFGAGQYSAATTAGRQLIAHELTHTIQQQGMAGGNGLAIDTPDSAYEKEAQQTASRVLAGGGRTTGTLTPPAPQLSRADPDAVGYTMRLGTVARTGLQFFPTNLTDTQVGPVTIPGGLLMGGASRLNVIIGENLSMRRLARQLLPLWLTATPFTPPGAAAPLPVDPITEDELAQALLVYNDTYLPVPAMTNWKAGLRLPLPIEVDEATGMGTLHPLQIKALATGFTPAMAAAVDLPAPANAVAPAATIQADAAAFLASEPTALGRGIHLQARAITNAQASLPLIREVMNQLGAGAFDVALEFTKNMYAREADLLSAQRDGAAIMGIILQALAAAPATLTAEQQEALDRANLMFALHTGGPALPPPTSTRNRAEKTITVDTLKLFGATKNPQTLIATANAIFSQCDVRVVHGVDAQATQAQTTALIGDTDLHSNNSCGSPSAEERHLFRDARATFNMTARFSAFLVQSVSGIAASGYSCIPSSAPHALFRNRVVVVDSGDDATLAHELGHILMNLGPHPPSGLMGARPPAPAMRQPSIANTNCNNLYANA